MGSFNWHCVDSSGTGIKELHQISQRIWQAAIQPEKAAVKGWSQDSRRIIKVFIILYLNKTLWRSSKKHLPNVMCYKVHTSHLHLGLRSPFEKVWPIVQEEQIWECPETGIVHYSPGITRQQGSQVGASTGK